jgi:hypothetical protein
MEITPLGFLGTGKEPPAYRHGSLVADHVKEKPGREVPAQPGKVGRLVVRGEVNWPRMTEKWQSLSLRCVL